MFRFIFCAVALSRFAVAHTEKEACPSDKQHYRATIRHIESGGIGYEDGYTTLETFLTSNPSRWIVTPFLDARGHIFNDGKLAANFGVGLRTLGKNRIYGINTYYDYRNVKHFHSNQIGVGLETLGELFDFRINGYLPVGAKISNPYDTAFKGFSGNYMLLSQKYQSAMKGADSELGFHFGKFESFNFYAAAGPYYFVGKKDPVTWGGKARIMGSFKDIVTVGISDSYDKTFHNKLQGQISLSFSFGPKAKVKAQKRTCKVANTLNDRMLQSVGRQEIIVIDSVKESVPAIDPTTGLPYFFVFVDNTSHSAGTYESPYHSLAQAQDGSSPNDIIYVFPGDGTTKGMDSGIFLKANQKFWGSGIDHSLQTSQGMISIPAQSSSFPTITNTNYETDGNVITLATNNAISGFVITSAIYDAIYGVDPQSLDVSYCTMKNNSTYAIEAYFSGDAFVSLTNNQFSNNANGISLTLDGTSTVVCLDNTFTDQTSVSSFPIEIAANSNTFTAQIQNNIFDSNTTGGILFHLDNVISADMIVTNNMMTNNGTGSMSTLGSSFVIISNGTNEYCSITLTGNAFSGNGSDALYLHTSGRFTTLQATVSENTISDNEGSGLVFATPVDIFTLVATNNTISGTGDNGIATIGSGLTSTGNITINNNIITDITGESNGIAINQDFSTLNLTMLNNEIHNCEGTGILSYAPTGIEYLSLNISGNAISNCENISSNAGSGIDIEQYTNLIGYIANNALSDNVYTAVAISSSLSSPTACLTLTGNSSTNYVLTNPSDGLFNLSPCNVDTVNTGEITISGVIDLVQSCTNPISCIP
jgi:trimeric autotransporter adhesin